MGPKCLRDQRATMDFLGSPLPMHCPETTFGPDKREIWLAAWAAAAWLSAATSGSLTVASEISTSTCSPALPASEENWCLEGRPPPQGVPLTSPSLAVMLRPLSPQSPSLLRFLSPLKFHVQYGSGVYLKDQQPLCLFLVSKISPGGWLLSLHKQGSFYSPHRPWWDLELWPCTQVFFTHFLEIKDPSPAYQLFLTSNIKDQFRSLSWQCNLTAYERVPNFQAPKTHWPPLLHLSKFVLSIQQWQVILFQWDLYITQVTSQWYPDTPPPSY